MSLNSYIYIFMEKIGGKIDFGSYLLNFINEYDQTATTVFAEYYEHRNRNRMNISATQITMIFAVST